MLFCPLGGRLQLPMTVPSIITWFLRAPFAPWCVFFVNGELICRLDAASRTATCAVGSFQGPFARPWRSCRRKRAIWRSCLKFEKTSLAMISIYIYSKLFSVIMTTNKKLWHNLSGIFPSPKASLLPHRSRDSKDVTTPWLPYVEEAQNAVARRAFVTSEQSAMSF